MHSTHRNALTNQVHSSWSIIIVSKQLIAKTQILTNTVGSYDPLFESHETCARTHLGRRVWSPGGEAAGTSGTGSGSSPALPSWNITGSQTDKFSQISQPLWCTNFTIYTNFFWIWNKKYHNFTLPCAGRRAPALLRLEQLWQVFHIHNFSSISHLPRSHKWPNLASLSHVVCMWCGPILGLGQLNLGNQCLQLAWPGARESAKHIWTNYFRSGRFRVTKSPGQDGQDGPAAGGGGKLLQMWWKFAGAVAEAGLAAAAAPWLTGSLQLLPPGGRGAPTTPGSIVPAVTTAATAPSVHRLIHRFWRTVVGKEDKEIRLWSPDKSDIILEII